jgi:hypothetical protein
MLFLQIWRNARTPMELVAAVFDYCEKYGMIEQRYMAADRVINTCLPEIKEWKDKVAKERNIKAKLTKEEVKEVKPQ